MSCLYILGINPLLVMSFANIFSDSLGCLFNLFIVSLRAFNLIRFHLFIFAFISITSGDRNRPPPQKKKNNAAIYVKECSGYVFL